jgi:electron transport complex protein RnfC
MNSIFLQSSPDLVLSKNNQCINCGRCVDACPVNLDVNLICRYSEFSLYEKSLEIGGADCIECGLCAYNCPAGRSLVQLIRLAKYEVEESKGEDVI